MTKRIPCLLLLLSFLSGCPELPPDESTIWLYQVTPTPVTMTASVENSIDPFFQSITVSSGLGLGLACSERCVLENNTRPPCQGIIVTVDPPELASIHETFLFSGREGVVVMVANAPGAGTLTVSSPCVDNHYPLSVIPR